MRLVVPLLVAVAISWTTASARADEDEIGGAEVALEETIPAAPPATADFERSRDSDATSGVSTELDDAESAQALADPFGLELRARELDAILAADATSAEQARTFSAVMGYVIGAIGIGATPVFFALDDGSGLYPILSILPLQLGALSLATAILGSVTLSTEERRYAAWRRMSEEGRPDLAQIGRHEGYLVADADRARDARLFTLAQGIAGIATGLFTGIVGVALSNVELTQITLGSLGAVELLLGALQLLGAIDAGEIESRPARYETRTGVRLSLRADGFSGSF